MVSELAWAMVVERQRPAPPGWRDSGRQRGVKRKETQGNGWQQSCSVETLGEALRQKVIGWGMAERAQEEELCFPWHLVFPLALIV